MQTTRAKLRDPLILLNFTLLQITSGIYLDISVVECSGVLLPCPWSLAFMSGHPCAGFIPIRLHATTQQYIRSC